MFLAAGARESARAGSLARRPARHLAAVTTFILSIAVVSCDLTRDASDEVLVASTLQRVEVGGSCWLLETRDGRAFQLTNLAEDHKVSGLRVLARLRLRRDMVSTCMVGEIAEVLELDGKPVR